MLIVPKMDQFGNIFLALSHDGPEREETGQSSRFVNGRAPVAAIGVMAGLRFIFVDCLPSDRTLIFTHTGDAQGRLPEPVP